MSVSTNDVSRLLKAQDALNVAYAGEEWRKDHHPFVDYIWIESGELLEHHGQIFHYKKKTPDWGQVKLELIDILHFGLSDMLMHSVKGGSAAHIFKAAVEGVEAVRCDEAVIKYCKAMVKSAVKNGVFDPYYFARLVLACGFTLEEIFSDYMLKYTLNAFRIANGSVTGDYNKHWSDGREDNEHLLELAHECNGDFDLLKEKLAERYAQ